MGVTSNVGGSMVFAVMGDPPQRPALCGSGSGERSGELHTSADLEGTMGKAPVIKAGDAKSPDRIGEHRYTDCDSTPAHKEDADQREMREHERDA
jgi:hypothetical protein